MSRRLLVTDGGREREVLVVAPVVVGRDPTCDITGSDDLLSRRHAEFAPSSDRVIVRDLGSRNGIFVNGTRVVEVALNSNDVVQIGALKIRYVSDNQPISRVAIPTPAFSSIDEDLTGYRPSSSEGDEATSFVPSRTAGGMQPPPPHAPAARGRAESAAPAGPAPAQGTPAAPATDPAPADDAAPLTVPMVPAVAVIVISVAVLVWEANRAGAPLWLLMPLLSALAAAFGVGITVASKSPGTKSSGIKRQ